MTSTQLSLIVMLLASVNGTRNVNAAQPCSEVLTPRTVVTLGSTVAATCVIREGCHIPIAPMEWRLDEKVLPGSSEANQSVRISQVLIPSFNSSMATLTCNVQTTPPLNMGGVIIKAGYAPSVPQHLYCQTNLTTPSSMTCSWDPGRDTYLPTQYSLHTHIRGSKNYSYNLAPGHHQFTIQRSHFVWFKEMDIYVKAVNDLGETTSVPVTLEPLSSAKLKPPTILSIQALPQKYGCLRIRWTMSRQESWASEVNGEVQLVEVESGQWSGTYSFKKTPSKSIDQCGLQHGTRYTAQMRVRHKKSPWSEWSPSHSGVTLESAPTGRLDSWMKVSGDHPRKQVNVHLFWKPSKLFRANGQNVSYVVSRTKQPGERGQLCATAGQYCTFRAPARAKVFLSAVNAAGRSQPTKIHIYSNKGLSVITEMSVTPHDHTSLLVQWTSVDFDSLLGYVVEWRPLLQPDPAFLQFQFTNKTQNSFFVSAGIEPYKPYGIWVYPRFKDGVGLPRTVNAFSRQKAPSKVPKLRVEKTWHFRVELVWDEIPLDQMNGELQGYGVYYGEENKAMSVIHAKPDDRRITLNNLNPQSVYKAFLMVSTFGGSQNGSAIHFKTESNDMVSVVISVTCGPGLVFVCVAIFLHFTNRRRIKSLFFSTIPDPANSSVNKWSIESLEELIPGFIHKEPNLQVNLSHLSFLDLPSKVQKEKDDGWLRSAEDTSDLGESICGSPTLPGYCSSNSDSVPYATVMFSTSPSADPAPRVDHSYLRSESTQPLLEAEEAFTPKCYQNISADTANSEPCFFGSSDGDGIQEVPESDVVWDEFPFLSALEVYDSEND